MEVTFTNVTITIGNLSSPEEAYDLLCGYLGLVETDGAGGKGSNTVEWQTDRYFTDEEPDLDWPTGGLFPAPESQRETK